MNAKGDLGNVRFLLHDLAAYAGRHVLEVVLLINNYDAASPPPEIDEFLSWGLRVEAVPAVRRAGGVVLGGAAADGETTAD